MAMTAMDIYKLLPQTNCGDCGSPTCLAFAMQLANKKATLADCPHASGEAKEKLASASQPPIREVKMGSGDNELVIGKETVMFRHEETFHNQCGLAARVSDELSADKLEEKIENINQLCFERIGEMIGVELIAVIAESGDPEKYKETVSKIVADSRQTPILCSFDTDMIATVLNEVEGLVELKPLIYGANNENYKEMAELAKKHDLPLAVYAEGLEELAELTPEIKEMGVEDLVLDSGSRETPEVLNDLTQIRRQALKNNFRPLGYPTINFADQGGEQENILKAATYICKYAGIVVIDSDQAWQVLPLLALRQNIYTDPRVPPTIEAKLYEVGDVTEESPVLLTTNFALTYFTVQGEVENSRIPAYILAVDTEGQSVLTAYSSENMTPESVAKAMEECNLEEEVDHKDIIIPGYVAVMSGSLEGESGWNVEVGPREAGGLPKYLRDYTGKE